MKLVFLGKPLSGKGTQASLLSTKLRIPHISTGELLRTEVQKKTTLGKKVAPLLAQGILVPDMLIFSVLKKQLPKKGFILDGFPRDLVQAKLLENIVHIDLVVDVLCPDRTILKRAISRMSCTMCGSVYGLNKVPKKKESCDHCQGKLIRRRDDSPATVKKRLLLYQKETQKLIHFYKTQKTYFSVHGEDPVTKVQKEIIRKIETIK